MKKGKATGILQSLELLGVLSYNANTKISIEIEKRLQDSIHKSKKIIEENKDVFKDENKNYFDLFRVYSERNSVLSLAIPL
jgi:hypothetical protein